jgi:hypothetical protein
VDEEQSDQNTTATPPPISSQAPMELSDYLKIAKNFYDDLDDTKKMYAGACQVCGMVKFQNEMSADPISKSDLQLEMVRHMTLSSTTSDFILVNPQLIVRKSVWLEAFQFLKRHSPVFQNIDLDERVLETFPENDIPESLVQALETSTDEALTQLDSGHSQQSEELELAASDDSEIARPIHTSTTRNTAHIFSKNANFQHQPGSRADKHRSRRQIMTMVREHNGVDLFFTVSSAEMHRPEVQRLIYQRQHISETGVLPEDYKELHEHPYKERLNNCNLFPVEVVYHFRYFFLKKNS